MLMGVEEDGGDPSDAKGLKERGWICLKSGEKVWCCRCLLLCPEGVDDLDIQTKKMQPKGLLSLPRNNTT